MTNTFGIDRRQFLKTMAAASAATLPAWAQNIAAAAQKTDRILVVLELSGGNDGLNTVVPYSNDAYYRHRPTIGIQKQDLLLLDDNWGFNKGMLGFKRLWDKGQLATFHGCGYDNPSYSHFTSMAWLHTAAPNSGAEYGWVGRLADSMAPAGDPNFIVNIDTSRSLAVNSRKHIPVVFDDPAEFQQRQFGPTPDLPPVSHRGMANTGNPSRDFLLNAASSGRDAAQRVRSAWDNYKTPVDYGIIPLDLDKIAACIAADMPTRLYYTSFRNNAFDTHVQQGPLHQRLISYACDAVHGFMADMERLGVADKVLLLAFSEFGRRVAENTNGGTDHGTANTWFMAGGAVQGGHYGEPPSLTRLHDYNLIPTTDFRRVYATAIEWMAPGMAELTLGANYEAFKALT